ncbi:hypothetical protein LMIY3S_01507 [Labrys miyagiensis]
MSALIHALYDRPDIAMKAKADLEAIGIARNEISIVEGGGGTAQEASHILDQHGLSSETAATYVHALGQGGAFLWLRVDPALRDEAEIVAVLDRDGAILTDRVVINDDAQELSEAEGWDDFNSHGNEHSPDPDAESMWTGRDGSVR